MATKITKLFTLSGHKMSRKVSQVQGNLGVELRTIIPHKNQIAGNISQQESYGGRFLQIRKVFSEGPVLGVCSLLQLKTFFLELFVKVQHMLCLHMSAIGRTDHCSICENVLLKRKCNPSIASLLCKVSNP